MPEKVEFNSYDRRFKLRGFLFRPVNGKGNAPIVIMSGGYGDSAERMFPTAEGLAKAGFGVLLYEHRNTGISEGEPRLEVDPIAQVRDMSLAVTFAQTLPGFDKERLGLFGTSFSGGHVLAVAGPDKRVKCVVACNPWIAGYEIVLSGAGAKGIEGFTKLVQQERRNLLEGKEPALMTLGRTEDDPSHEPSLFRDNAAMNYYANGPAGSPLSWKNELTVYSLSYALEYDVRQYAKRISPTPLLMMVAAADHTMPASLGFEFYNEALEPKRLVVLPGGHYDAYMPDGSLDLVIQASAEWFRSHL